MASLGVVGGQGKAARVLETCVGGGGEACQTPSWRRSGSETKAITF